MSDSPPAAGEGAGSGPAPADADPFPIEAFVEPAAGAVMGPAFTCHDCGGAVGAGEWCGAGGLFVCPACGAEFFGAYEPTDVDRAAAACLEADHDRRGRELNDLRIKQLVTERRATFRTRSYYVVGLCASAAVAIQLGWRAARGFGRHGVDPRPAAYLSGAIAFLVVGWLCLYKVRELNADLAERVLAEPTTPPDFSTLSDGSHLAAEAAANLERMGGQA
jgi:hypothetical protein